MMKLFFVLFSLLNEVWFLGFSFAGMVTDGEFNSLRTQGETRPIHLWQIIHDARESVSKQGVATLEQMLIKIGGVYYYCFVFVCVCVGWGHDPFQCSLVRLNFYLTCFNINSMIAVAFSVKGIICLKILILIFLLKHIRGCKW